MRLVLGLGAVAVAATVLTACGSSNGNSSTTAGGTTPPAASGQQDMSGYGYGSGAGATGAGTTVTVDETEFKLGLSTTTFSPGTYTFKINDTGHATHNFVIEGPGIEEQKSSAVSPGDSTSVTVKLQKGTYELYCGIGNHKAQGMHTEITVG